MGEIKQTRLFIVVNEANKEVQPQAGREIPLVIRVGVWKLLLTFTFTTTLLIKKRALCCKMYTISFLPVFFIVFFYWIRLVENTVVVWLSDGLSDSFWPFY